MATPFPIYYTLDKLVAAGRKQVTDCTVISFDLFDTLLIRRVHDPDLIKLPVARYIAALSRLEGKKWSWQKVQNLRDLVEKNHRQETGKEFADFEACYPKFMAEVLEVIFEDKADSGLLQQVTDYELAMESSMLVPRGPLVEWVKELHSQKKRIFILSDIYLPAEHLERLVENAGLLPYVEAVVSSADSFKAKASGLGFPLMQERYGLEKKGWLHIGDNPVSDGLRPYEFGIQTMVLHDGSEKWRKAIIKRHINYSAGKPFWRGRALQQLMMPLEQENVCCSHLYNEGYNFLAPLLGAFVQEIAEKCRRLKISKVFFLAREGWTFEKVWKEITPVLFPDGDLPEIEYLYVSRMALAGVSCAHQGLLQQNADIVFLPPGNKDFTDVCRVFNLKPELLEKHLQQHGFSLNTVLSPQHDGYLPENRLRFNELLEDEDFQQDVKEQVKSSSQALQLYLESVGFFNHLDVALVDIGWLGTIQRFFYEAIAHRPDKPRCHGFLFSATRGIEYPSTPDNYIEGLLYDKHRFDLAGSSVLYARDLFEEACRAPHPTLNGYSLTDDGYRLDFRTTEDATGRAEQEQDRYFSDLQRGVFDGVSRYAAASALLGYSLAEYKPWLNYLLTEKLAFPRADEVDAIRHKHHLDDFHGNNTPSNKAGKGQKSLWGSSLFNLRCNPFLRPRFFLSHIKHRLGE